MSSLKSPGISGDHIRKQTEKRLTVSPTKATRRAIPGSSKYPTCLDRPSKAASSGGQVAIDMHGQIQRCPKKTTWVCIFVLLYGDLLGSSDVRFGRLHGCTPIYAGRLPNLRRSRLFCATCPKACIIRRATASAASRICQLKLSAASIFQ